MKICYIFREKERKAHSIEILFNTISNEVEREGIIIEKWYKPLSNLRAVIAVRKLKADVYHITGDCYFLALFLPRDKTIMTIHDIGMYKNHAKTLKSRLFVLMSFILPLKLLKISTAISELTKNDLVKILGVREDKIKVIHNPLVLKVSFSPKSKYNRKPRILQIGTGAHKNLNGLVEAVKGLECLLDIVGSPDQKLIDKMNSYGIEYIISKNISNEEVIHKYENCDILYFASFSEGFGLPILEAQAIGRPLITSRLDPMSSVCGKGGLLVDPKNPKEIRDALNQLINDDATRSYCIDQGLLNVKEYDRKEIASRYIDIYKTFI